MKEGAESRILLIVKVRIILFCTLCKWYLFHNAGQRGEW